MVSDDLKRAIDESGMTRYAIAKAIGLDHAAMSRLMNGKAGVSLAMLDKIGNLLGLRIVADKKDGPYGKAGKEIHRREVDSVRIKQRKGNRLAGQSRSSDR